MTSLTQQDFEQITIVSMDDGHLVCSEKGETDPGRLLIVGKVDTRFRNLFTNALSLHLMLETCIKANESLLAIIEAEGLDKTAYDLTKLIGVMKIIQKCSIEGTDALTGLSDTAK